MVAAVSVSAFFDQDIVVDSFHSCMLNCQLGRFRSFIMDRFQLVFGRCLPGYIIVRVPGSIGQAVYRAFIIFIDRHAAGSYRAVAAVDDHIAVTDIYLAIAGAVDIDASTDLQFVSQLHFIISAAAAVRGRRNDDVAVACRNSSLLRCFLRYFIQLAAVDGIGRSCADLPCRYILYLTGRPGAAYADNAHDVADAGPFSIAAVASNAVDRRRCRITAQSDAVSQRDTGIVTKREGIISSSADRIAVADSGTGISSNIIAIAKSIGRIAAYIIKKAYRR